jgi:hypothetical protein
LITTVSALAIDGAATAIAPRAAMTYPSFFMLSSPHISRRLNFAGQGTFRRNFGEF